MQTLSAVLKLIFNNSAKASKRIDGYVSTDLCGVTASILFKNICFLKRSDRVTIH